MKLTILDGHAVNPGDLPWDAFKELAEITEIQQKLKKCAATS